MNLVEPLESVLISYDQKYTKEVTQAGNQGRGWLSWWVVVVVVECIFMGGGCLCWVGRDHGFELGLVACDM